MQEATDKNCKRALYAWRKMDIEVSFIAIRQQVDFYVRQRTARYIFVYPNDSSNSKYLALAGN